MQLWVDWLDKWASAAIEDDPRLLDRDWLRAEIFKARNGEERFARRVALRNAKGIPLWVTKLPNRILATLANNERFSSERDLSEPWITFD